MRVIAGKYRGRRLTAPNGTKTRPTTDRVKEALFSIIQSKIEFNGVSVLDICAGTGGLGIEALSRGASSCCFIEQDRVAVEAIKKNLNACKVVENPEVIQMEAARALELLIARGVKFQIIFFDPPYNSGRYDKIFNIISKGGLLDSDGLFIMESASKGTKSDILSPMLLVDERIYGDTKLEFLTLEER